GEVTWLLRSLPDAAAAAAATGARVLCGTLPKLAEDGRYGLVVALDGLDRLCSTEGPQYDWRECLQALARAVAPAGTLLVAVGNELGLHRLVAPRPPGADRTDAQWHAVGEADPARPGTPQRLAEELRAAGLPPVAAYAAWPLPQAPTVLAERAALAEPELAGPLAATVAAACAAGFAGREVLTDPRRLAGAGVRAGLGAELAPAWVAVAARPADPAPASPAHAGPWGAAPPDRAAASDRRPAGRPPAPVLIAGPAGGVVEVSGDGAGGWRRRVLGAPGTGAHRDPTGLSGPLPGGRLVEEALLAACRRADLPTLRRLLRAYASWLGGLPAGRATAATVDNVLFDGDRFAVLDPTWTGSAEPAEPGVAVLRALRRFAVTLADGGYPHPWPSSDVDGLTTLLAAAAGAPHDADLRRRAAALDAAAPAAYPPPDPVWGGAVGWRERAELLRQLRARLDEAAVRIDRYERELTERDAELRRAHLLIAAFSGSPAYRLARLARAAAGRARRLAGRARRLATGRIRRAAAGALPGRGTHAAADRHPSPHDPLR
ncbi:MAG TPA: hypothetical protein VNV66_17655, partial [Pilimelia sp.]|nr:hypothetical protein [Pilimelia sp.]